MGGRGRLATTGARLYAAAVFAGLTGTGIAKLVSALGHARILDQVDPVFLLSYRTLMLMAAILELGTSIWILRLSNPLAQAGLTLWICSILIVYRLLEHADGSHQHWCPCFGTVTDSLGISPHTVGTISELMLFLLTASSLGILVGFRNLAQGAH